MQKRNSKGQYKQVREIWDFDNWDDGFIDNKGRMRVYRPDYPNAYRYGYALRSHIVFWLTCKRVHKGELHHKNGDVLDDRIENLEEMTRSEHRILHQSRPVWIMCENCGEEFSIPNWRMMQRKTRFCSQNCYHNYPRSKEHKENIAIGNRKAWREGRRK